MSLSSTNGDPGGSSGLPEVSGLQSVAKPEIEIFSLNQTTLKYILTILLNKTFFSFALVKSHIKYNLSMHSGVRAHS